ncbi:hypothetical protein DKX38_010593 [Salix brachista]|uniref:Uncharacterized protein n=1 Tax=Salix brachista TaxID=2182728 RepID=A0A5N5ME57_9ROSI|nr:hypothetical protein DKX38_010593 [Salix brachista]
MTKNYRLNEITNREQRENNHKIAFNYIYTCCGPRLLFTRWGLISIRIRPRKPKPRFLNLNQQKLSTAKKTAVETRNVSRLFSLHILLSTNFSLMFSHHQFPFPGFFFFFFKFSHILATLRDLNIFAQISSHLFAQIVVELIGNLRVELNQFRWRNLMRKNNQQKVRDFIKHVYVDRRYTGEKSQEKLPLLKLVLVAIMQTDKEESGEKRWVVLYSGGSRSPNYEDRHGWSEGSGFSGRADDKTIKYYYDERRSFEMMEYEASVRDSGSNAPMVRPLKLIPRGNIPPLQAGEHSKTPNRKDADGSAHNQRFSFLSGPMESADGNPVQQKSHNSESSVDLNAISKSSDATAAPPAQENLLSSEGGNCSSHDSPGKKNALPAPKPNTLEFLLMELSVPSVIPADTSGPQTGEAEVGGARNNANSLPASTSLAPVGLP